MHLVTKILVLFVLSKLVLGAKRCELKYELVNEDGIDLCLKIIKDRKKICTFVSKTGECKEIGYKTVYRKDYKKPIVFGEEARRLKLASDRDENCIEVKKDVKTKYYMALSQEAAIKYCRARAKEENASLLKTYYVSNKVSCLLNKEFKQCD